MTSLSRRVCILMVVCSLLAEGLLVEAKGGGKRRGRGRSRGGYSYGGGGYSYGGGEGDFPVWAITLIIAITPRTLGVFWLFFGCCPTLLLNVLECPGMPLECPGMLFECILHVS